MRQLKDRRRKENPVIHTSITGEIPCPKHGFSDRYERNGTCKQCYREYHEPQRLENMRKRKEKREKIRADALALPPLFDD
jgi:hypothetical protein